MAMSDRKLSKRVAKIGASNFESVEDTARRQADMLRRLEEAGLGPAYVGFHDCRPDYCGLVHCAAGCWFNIRRRWLNDVLAAYKMFRRLPGPLYEVRVIPQAWQQPLGNLRLTNIAAAKQFTRRRLDSRNGRDAVIVGMYKATKDPKADRWFGEIHAVVGGIDKVGVRRAFRMPLGDASPNAQQPSR